MLLFVVPLARCGVAFMLSLCAFIVRQITSSSADLTALGLANAVPRLLVCERPSQGSTNVRQPILPRGDFPSGQRLSVPENICQRNNGIPMSQAKGGSGGLSQYFKRLFGGGIVRRYLLRVSPEKSTSVPLRF
jgi:hypothetical protein